MYEYIYVNVTICATHTIRYNIIYSRYTGVLYVQIDEFLVPCSLLVVTHKEEKKKGRGGRRSAATTDKAFKGPARGNNQIPQIQEQRLNLSRS